MADQTYKDWPLNADRVIVVGATDRQSKLADFSNYGPREYREIHKVVAHC
jgi:Subtilase family